jgi:hypothetical protein
VGEGPLAARTVPVLVAGQVRGAIRSFVGPSARVRKPSHRVDGDRSSGYPRTGPTRCPNPSAQVQKSR